MSCAMAINPPLERHCDCFTCGRYRQARCGAANVTGFRSSSAASPSHSTVSGLLHRVVMKNLICRFGLPSRRPVLTNGSCFIVGTEPELGDDLLINPALVVLDRQEQVGALFVGELTYSVEVWSASAWCLVSGAWIRMPSSSRMLSNAFRATRSWDPPVSN